MARPTIVIGVGGTGQGIVTMLKKNLLESNRGKLPQHVKLLAFDTMPEAAAEANSGISFEKVKIGKVELAEKTEFFPLRGNGWQVGENVIKGQSPHIKSWFDAEHYRRKVTPALWDLSAGAGRVRQFGRLAFFMNLDGSEVKIRQIVSSAMQSLKSQVKQGNELEIVIVASFAGGTGAGMFIDMGVLCRSLGSEVGNNLIIRGVFVLPRAFVSMGDVDDEARRMMARSFAVWRELDRFMNLGPDYGNHKVDYKPGNQDTVDVKARPFDHCYVVDTRRATHSLETAPPQEGVFPTVSDFIEMVIEDRVGRKISEDTRNHYGAPLASTDKPGYSTFGTYSVAVPIYYYMRGHSAQFMRDLLNRWLLPLSERDKIVDLANDQNKEKGAGTRRGKDEALEFLRAQPGIGGFVGPQSISLILNTFLFPKLAEVYETRAKTNGTLLDQEARGGLAQLVDDQVDQASYIGKICLLPKDHPLTKIMLPGAAAPQEVKQDDINEELRVRVWDEAPSARDHGDTPADALVRYKTDIPAFLVKHYGSGNNQGTFGMQLLKAKLFQIERFRQMLQTWTANTLNGASETPFKSLSGKLGYAEDFYKELNAAVVYFNEYIAEVKTRRGKLSVKKDSDDRMSDAFAEFDKHVDDKCAFFFTHPRAHVKLREYLEAVDEAAEVAKDDMVLQALGEIGTAIQKIIQAGQNQLTEWKQTLVLESGSIYRSMLQEVTDCGNMLNQEALSKVIHRLIQIPDYVQTPAQIDAEMGRFSWVVKENEKGETQISLAIKDAEDKVRVARLDTKREDIMDWLISIGLKVYEGMPSENKVLDRIMIMRNPNFAEANEFADEMAERSQPLVDLSQNANTGVHEKFVYVRIAEAADNENAATYRDDVKTRLESIHLVNKAERINVLDSSTVHKITILQTVDKINDIDFNIWQTLHDQYKRHILSSIHDETAARLHIFPAEVNSARYEAKISLLLKNEFGVPKAHRVFHPNVAMLLEDESRTRLFFQSYAYGLIKLMTHDNQSYYYLEMGEKKVMLTAPQAGFPDIFKVMHAFIIGEDVTNPTNRIVWDDLERAIRILEAGFRQDGTFRDKIEAQFKGEAGLVRRLNQKAQIMRNDFKSRNEALAKASAGFAWLEGQDYYDLADLAEIIYREMLQESAPMLKNQGSVEAPML